MDIGGHKDKVWSLCRAWPAELTFGELEQLLEQYNIPLNRLSSVTH